MSRTAMRRRRSKQRVLKIARRPAGGCDYAQLLTIAERGDKPGRPELAEPDRAPDKDAGEREPQPNGREMQE